MELHAFPRREYFDKPLKAGKFPVKDVPLLGRPKTDITRANKTSLKSNPTDRTF